MISEFYINNFKSLVNFKFQLDKFTCLIGLNGSGKSTILQAVDFTTQLIKGHIEDWLKTREWGPEDLLYYFKSTENINFVIKLQIEKSSYSWRSEFNANTLTCPNEEIVNDTSGEILFKVADRAYHIGNNPLKPIEFKYEGSLLSILQDEVLTEELINIRDFLISVKSTDLLSPQLMRKRARQADNDLGLGGEKLSAFLYDLSDEKKSKLNQLIKEKFQPTFESVETTTIQAGWKKLSIIEKVYQENNLFKTKRLSTEARHISDGLLRLLAILSQMMTNHQVLLFDEIEDGINPEIVEKLVDLLISTPQQILITTHSPILLNYIEDEQAKKSVIFTYKNKKGITQQQPFFTIKGVAEKLEILGPGEAMLDVSLNELAQELSHD
ncbi:MAG: ATP-binding protein [Pseudomonadota bacterium]